MDTRLREPQRIYECYVEISRPKDGEDGQITSVYPKEHDIDDDTRKQLPKFTFPTNAVNHNEEHFTFVLTDLDSKYRFGFCLYRPKGDTCMCIISDLPWYKVFYRALDKISELKLDLQNELVEPLLSGLYEHPLPSAGEESLCVKPSGSADTLSYSFPIPTTNRRLPEIPTDHNLTYFYTNIHYNVLLHLFANMIFERRIIITSNSLSLLSASVHGCVMLLYPLHWQHIFIPIMPKHVMDYCAAPMPYLMGIHSSLMEEVRRMPMDDVVILDMDENMIESPHVEDLANMPDDVISELKHVLKKESSGYGDNACKAFLLAMVSMIGGYRKALKFREGETEVVFDEEAFFTSRPQMEEFLSSLLHFQHFRQFINHKIEQLKNQTGVRDLFDKEVMFYDEEMKGTAQEKIKTAFNRFVTSTKGGGKKLLEQGGKWSSQLQKGVTKGYGKIVDKKKFQKFVKDTKRTFQEMGREVRIEEIGPVENGPAGATTEKNNTFPGTDLKRSNSSLSTSSQPGTVVKKPPPRVIPYHMHQEGKRKLAEMLYQQDQKQRLSTGSLDHARRMLTPPDTPGGPHSLQLPDDHMEKASLDSRSSTDASVSVSSGEVATGTLIDLTEAEGREGGGGGGEGVEGGGGERDEKRGGGEREGAEGGESSVPQQRERSSSGSDSMVSTASSSSEETGDPKVQRKEWVKFDEDNSQPPLPPPRTQLEDTDTIHANPAAMEGTDQVFDFNPFSKSSATTATSSATSGMLEDFGAQVAQTLFKQSRDRSSLDSYTANLMASASQDIYRALDMNQTISERNVSQTSLPEPLIPSSSSTSVSSLDTRNTSTNPFAPSLKSTANGFPSSSSHPQMERVRPRGPPPPKPQPYSGKPVSELKLQATDDPFSNLLEGISMHAYASSGASVSKCDPPSRQLQNDLTSPQHSRVTAVESPLV